MNYRLAIFLAALCAFCAPKLHASELVWVSSLDVSKIDQEWGHALADKSVDGHKITIGGKTFEHGLGTHAASECVIDLKKSATHFNASVGVDDEVNGDAASIEFHVLADGKPVWNSGIMKAGEPAKSIDLNVTGADRLTLSVDDANDGNNFDHADWGDARLVTSGEHPQIVARAMEAPEILTPKAADTPRLTGPKVFGVRPGAPFLFMVTATGDRPMEFAADALPEGLRLNAATGQITGALPKAGEFTVTVRAKNAKGVAERKLQLVVGDKIALTPPMGWNSWNCWAGGVDQEKVLKAAQALVSTKLAQHGWTYVNIDDTWQGERDPQSHVMKPNDKFLDLKKLCDEIHRLGLKVGIYSTPWITSYGRYAGSTADHPQGAWKKPGPGEPNQHRIGKFSFAKVDAQTWAAWGVDYLKYDWKPIDLPAASEMAEALKATGRDIVYSLANSAAIDSAPQYAETANSWRTSGDIRDTWESISNIGFSQAGWAPFAGPGHWNDPDMLVVGKVGWGPQLHPTRLSPNEQHTHVSLWCLLAAPLLIGCDLEQLDDFTLSLLTNDEVLDINQDALGKSAKRIGEEGRMEIFSKELEDGSRAVGLFNLSKVSGIARVQWSELGLSGKQLVRDLWRQKEVGTFDDGYAASVPAHGVVLVRVTPAK